MSSFAMVFSPQPKQSQVADLVEHSRASWIGVGGGRGAAKSYLIDELQLERRVTLPGTVGCIVMRNYDQVRKYHIEPLMRRRPELEQYLNKSEGNLKVPCEGGGFSQIDFSYAETLADVERRFRSANYYDIMVDQAEQFLEDELREMKKACRWPRVLGKCKMLLAFNMGGAGIQNLRKWFHTHEYNEREDPNNFAFVHVFPWDNVEWCRAALEQDGFTVQDYYYSWTNQERMAYCAARSDYGRDLNSEDDTLRNRDWLGSWESLEGAYFGRVYDDRSTLVTREQTRQLIKAWDTRWLSQDWGKSHYCSTHWHAKTIISPEEALRVLGWQVERPVNAVITFREKIVNEMASPDVARMIVENTPEKERRQTRQFFLSPDAFGERDSENTTAMNQGEVLRAHGLPEPEQADNDRVGGWGLMYNLLQDTKRHGTVDGEVWLISAECPELREAIPVLMRDPKNLDDVLKTDKGAARIEQDVSDSARYGLKSMLQPKKAVPREVREAEIYRSACSPTDAHLRMLAFREKESRHSRARGGRSWR